jgi:MATE family multidrug resistance protein
MRPVHPGIRRFMSDTTLAPLTRRRVFMLAFPIVLANAAVPMLGIADTAVIGQLGDAVALGAIAVGSLIFNFIYWGFGFLRMGTTGLAAQAVGAGDGEELRAVLARALLLGGAIGLALIVLQWPLGLGAFTAIGASEAVTEQAKTYFAIRIWGAPAILAVYSMLGFFIGLGLTGRVLWLQLFMNGLNIVLNVLFVLGFGWGVAGVAWGTLIAEWAAVTLGLILILRTLNARRLAGDMARLTRARLLDAAALIRTLAVNRDIFIRTLLLILAFGWFTATGARLDDDILAANHVLLQFLAFSAFSLDGFAFAAESLVGQAVGARQRERFLRAIRLTTEFAAVTALALTLGFLVFGTPVIHALTTAEDVRAAAGAVLVYAALHPVIAVWCFQLDGIYIGATRTADLRNTMIAAFTAYLAAWWWLTPAYGNDGLWIAFLIFFAARGIAMTIRLPALIRATMPG